MNYQGALGRRDLVWSGVVFWIMVTYYPFLTAGLIASLLISLYWERTSSGVRVFVNQIRGKVTHEAGGHLKRNIQLTQVVTGDPSTSASGATGGAIGGGIAQDEKMQRP